MLGQRGAAKVELRQELQTSSEPCGVTLGVFKVFNQPLSKAGSSICGASERLPAPQ